MSGCNGNDSERGQSLSDYEAPEGITEIAILGDFYYLPQSLDRFVDNGWTPQIDIVENFNDIYLPPQTYLEFYLERNGRTVGVTVTNPSDENVHILDGIIIDLSVRNVERNEVVAFAGITGGTSRRDILSVVETLEFHEGNNFINVTQRFEIGSMRLSIGINPDSDLTRHIRIALLDTYTRHLSLHRPDLSEEDILQQEAARRDADRAELIAASRSYEGVVVGVYSETRMDFPAVATEHGIVVIRREHDLLMAIRTRGLTDFDVDSLEIGDTVQIWVYLDSENDWIFYEGRGAIHDVLPNLLLVNGEREYFR